MRSEDSASGPSQPQRGHGQRDLEDEARQALVAHATRCAKDARQRHGAIDCDALPCLLADPLAVRYPTEIVFDAGTLQAGEAAQAMPRGERPEDGWVVWVHPYFKDRPDAVPVLVAYHLVRVNYGAAATGAEAEAFGATLLGMTQEIYYLRMCELTDELADTRA